MSLVFEKLSQIIGAGLKWDIGIGGTTLRLSECEWPVTVMLFKQGVMIGSMGNMQAGDYVEGVDYDNFCILNGPTSQSISVQISGGGAGSNRVLGEVSVINGEIQRVKADQCFILAGSLNAVAGQYSHIQLLNPAGSGKRLVLNKATLWASLAGVVYLGRYDTPLTTPMGGGYSKRLGGAPGVGLVKVQANAASLGSAIGIFSIDAALQSKDFPFSEPLVLEPGIGVLLLSSTVNNQLTGCFQWNEEAI